MDLIERVTAGDRRAIARLISMVENRAPGVNELLARLHGNGGRAHIIGVTGPPGGGKSSLVTQLVRHYRRRGQTVGVVAVDPTSPFTGGALLGDRVRMQEITTDPAVFIRSMATRGHLGGLAEATGDVITVLEAAGKDVILIETVGAGQSEVDIARTAHTTLVVEVPGLGDDVQAIKAGIMEIADVFVVNKADRDNADRVVMALELALKLGPRKDWQPPIIKTVAVNGTGIADLAAAIDRHLDHLRRSAGLAQRERERVRYQILDMVEHRLLNRLLKTVGRAEVDRLVDDVASRRLDPYSAVDELLRRVRVEG